MAHYVIEPKQPSADGPRLRIVEAKNQARAMAHVVQDTLIVRAAEPKDFVTMTRAGGEIEVAK